MAIKNSCQLITYPNSLGSNLQELHWVLNKYLKNVVGGVHILPFYPSSADRGFAPITYHEVEPEFGSWVDVQNIGSEFDLTIDFMVNHISQRSKYFQDYVENGNNSEYANMFLSLNKLTESGEVSAEDMAKIYTRKLRPPFFQIQRKDGSIEKVWSTFDYEQIDVDIDAEVTKEIFRNILIFLSQNKTKIIRMDAFAYSTKQLGTSCFFLEPKVWEILEWLSNYTAPFGVEILPEIHEHYSIQQKLSEKGYKVYDFALPMLCLNGLYKHNSVNLKNWLKICPKNQVTTLDTHDGIGIVDVQDLLSESEIEDTLKELRSKGGNDKLHHPGNSEYQNLDIYQVNCTYYSALGNNDDAYMVARTIQMFTPGIPQVYYVGLLAGKNDFELLEKTKNGRDINRHNYSLDEIETEIQKPVVQRLLKLMEFRNTCTAFNGQLTVLDSNDETLLLIWKNGEQYAKANINLRLYVATIEYLSSNNIVTEFSV
jgi:sucrose phosphorylase